MKDYDKHTATQDIMGKIKNDFYEAKLQVLYQSNHGEWTITNLHPSQAGKTY